MKYLSLILLMWLATTAFGKIWIVDNNSGSTAKDFTDLQSAHDGAAAGDTLYLIGSPNDYANSGISFSKRLIVIGPGYFLNENLNTQANPLSALVNVSAPCASIRFLPGSEGTALMGLKIIGRLSIETNNILIKRNYISEGACGTPTISIHGSNVLLSQNYISNNYTFTRVIEISNGQSGILIGNNFLIHESLGSTEALRSPETASVEIFHNVIIGRVTVHNATVQNNLFDGSSPSFTTSVVRNNSANAGVFLPAGNDNESNVSGFNSAFVATGSMDGRWQLTPTSIFKGTGTGGVDRGMFGGVEPYVLSGIPPIPTIYSVMAPAVGEKNTGLPVQLKVKSNN